MTYKIIRTDNMQFLASTEPIRWQNDSDTPIEFRSRKAALRVCDRPGMPECEPITEDQAKVHG